MSWPPKIQTVGVGTFKNGLQKLWVQTNTNEAVQLHAYLPYVWMSFWFTLTAKLYGWMHKFKLFLFNEHLEPKSLFDLFNRWKSEHHRSRCTWYKVKFWWQWQRDGLWHWGQCRVFWFLLRMWLDYSAQLHPLTFLVLATPDAESPFLPCRHAEGTIRSGLVLCWAMCRDCGKTTITI